MIKAKIVFFDASETLIKPAPQFTDYCIEFLGQLGIGVNLDLVSLAEKKADMIYQTHRRNLLRLYSNALSERCVWSHYYAELLYHLAAERPENSDWLEWGYRVNDFFEQSDNWSVYSDVFPILDKLQQMGFRMGIISDFGDKLPSHLEKLHLAPYFELVLVSSLINLCKNDDIQIYNKAAEMAQVKPSECLMIGDSYRSDIIPAKEAGFKTIWLNRNSLLSPSNEADAIVTSLIEISL